MNKSADINVSPPHGGAEQLWLHDLGPWGGEIMVSRGQVYRMSDLKHHVTKVHGKLIGATKRFTILPFGKLHPTLNWKTSNGRKRS